MEIVSIIALPDLLNVFAFIALHQEQAGVGEVVHIQEFPAGFARASECHGLVTVFPGLMEAADQGRQHV
jgi:hypothetical protein